MRWEWKDNLSECWLYRESKWCQKFNESQLKQLLDSSRISSRFHIIGDAAYGLHMNCLTPYGGELNSSQELYNFRHSSTRMMIERAFGLPKLRWRKLMMLNCRVENANGIIAACCVLHNLSIKTGDLSVYLNYEEASCPHLDRSYERVRTKAEKRDKIKELWRLTDK